MQNEPNFRRFRLKNKDSGKKRTQNEPNSNPNLYRLGNLDHSTFTFCCGLFCCCLRSMSIEYPVSSIEYPVSSIQYRASSIEKSHDRMPDGDAFLSLQNPNKAITIQVYSCFDDYGLQ